MDVGLARPLSSPAAFAAHAPVSIPRPRLLASERGLLLFVSDCAVLCSSLYAVEYLRAGARGPEATWTWLALLVVVWTIAAAVFDCYQPRRMSRLSRAISSAQRALLASCLAYLAIAYVAPAYASSPLHAAPLAVLVWIVLAFLGLAASRTAYEKLLTREGNERRLAVVGTTENARGIVELLRTDDAKDYRLVGLVAATDGSSPANDDDKSVIGSCGELMTIVRQHSIDEVVVADAQSLGPEVADALLTAYESGVDVRLATELFEELTGRIPVRSIGRHWLAVLPRRPWGGRTYDLARRAADILLASAALVILSPLLLLIVLAIRLESPGPVIYRQEREGRLGRRFLMLKFRTMCDGAEPVGPRWAAQNDPRRTRLGCVLRRLHLDELPQLCNVLVGDMSLIGPRPERPMFVAELARTIPFYRARLLVPPGITGWAQVRFSYAGSVEDSLEKLQHDLYYVKHRSPALDLVIALKTIGVFFRASGR